MIANMGAYCHDLCSPIAMIGYAVVVSAYTSYLMKIHICIYKYLNNKYEESGFFGLLGSFA